jgi:hypothetical protein
VFRVIFCSIFSPNAVFHKFGTKNVALPILDSLRKNKIISKMVCFENQEKKYFKKFYKNIKKLFIYIRIYSIIYINEYLDGGERSWKDF